MPNTFTIKITQEQADYLQRLGLEMDVRYDIISRIIENHRDDADNSVLTSAVFNEYHRDAAEAKLAYEVAKSKFSAEHLSGIVAEKTGTADPRFNWEIPNFAELTARITVL